MLLFYNAHQEISVKVCIIFLSLVTVAKVCFKVEYVLCGDPNSIVFHGAFSYNQLYLPKGALQCCEKARRTFEGKCVVEGLIKLSIHQVIYTFVNLLLNVTKTVVVHNFNMQSFE